jgi:hypothetical protein
MPTDPCSPSRHAHRFAAIAGTLALSLVAACSDDQASLCDARDDLRSSVEDLRDVDVAADGTDALTDALADVDEALDRVADEAEADRENEVNAVRAAFDQLSTTVTAIAEEPSPESVGAVGDALEDLAASVSSLVDEISSGCD